MRRTCDWCGRSYEYSRCTSRFCGDKCRNRWRYAVRAGMALAAGDGQVPPVEKVRDEDVQQAIATIHGALSVLDSASRSLKDPGRRSVCAYVLAKTSEALEEVGL